MGVKWSYPIARVAGIELRVHTTFFLLLAFVAWSYGSVGGTPAAIAGVVFILLLFLCVLLHEFGHAFAARAYGIRTPDITLLPIGGVARLERMPDNPIQELVVAIAGPAVNVVIALGLWLAIGRPSTLDDLAMFERPGAGLAAQLLRVNVLLIAFNMIPAFPMDGGRVLRALLAMRMKHTRATVIAARVGQGMAVLFGIAGFFGNPFLIFIAVFVFMGAQQELAYAQMREAADGLRVADAMITRFATLPETMPLSEALEEVLRDTQPIYPVTDDRLRVRGMVLRNELIDAARAGVAGNSLATVTRPIPSVGATASFDEAFHLMQQSSSPVLPVVNPAGQIIGLISLNLIEERAHLRRPA